MIKSVCLAYDILNFSHLEGLTFPLSSTAVCQWLSFLFLYKFIFLHCYSFLFSNWFLPLFVPPAYAHDPSPSSPMLIPLRVWPLSLAGCLRSIVYQWFLTPVNLLKGSNTEFQVFSHHYLVNSCTSFKSHLKQNLIMLPLTVWTLKLFSYCVILTEM